MRGSVMKNYKGIILAGGRGSRLFPLTLHTSKQLLPIYDKPMIYYPLSVLMLAGIREVMLIVTPEHHHQFKALLGDGSQWGISIVYQIQDAPKGLPEAYILAEEFLDGSPSMLILGDNLIYGQNIHQVLLKSINSQKQGGTIFAYAVRDPQRYGVVVLDQNHQAISIVEKPKEYISKWAIPGIYIFDHQVIEWSKNLQPSARGELEITDLMNLYLNQNELNVSRFSRGVAWFDSGTHESLLQASMYVHTLQTRQGQAIACLEEIAFRKGYIDLDQVKVARDNLKNTDYGKHLTRLIEDLNP